MAMRIGCDNAVYAVMETEEKSGRLTIALAETDFKSTVTAVDADAALPVYSAITRLPGLMHLNVNPNGAVTTAYFDDGPGDSMSSTGAIDVELEKNRLEAKALADLLGHAQDALGVVGNSAQDVAPYVALGFRSLKSNGQYKYYWLYKGKFAEPSKDHTTKGDGIEFQSDTISAQFVQLACDIGVPDGTNPTRYRKYNINAVDIEDVEEDLQPILAENFLTGSAQGTGTVKQPLYPIFAYTPT